MKFVTSACIAALITVLFCSQIVADELRTSVLRKAALEAGLVPSQETRPETNPDVALLGRLVFESELLSLGRDMACATCHRDRFGSADGLPNAVGVGGIGAGEARLASGGRIVPRNTLPFWGVGGVGFETFFWDGKVSGRGGNLTSQFGTLAPSDDPLVISAMLPPVEIDEMVGDIDHLATETTASAKVIYDQIVKQLATDPEIQNAAQQAYGKSASDLDFIKFGEAIAEFIRFNFGVRDTKFHKFVFGNAQLTEDEIAGGLVFYGKGRCSMCHNGPFFTDFDFHAIPSPSSHFGKNGFGVDYGRFNVTNDPDDRGRFRTPSLYNVMKTAPYGHSGAYSELSDVILAHSDPLAVLDFGTMPGAKRQDLYQQLRLWLEEPVSQSVITSEEVDQLIAFLSTLEYNPQWEISSP